MLIGNLGKDPDMQFLEGNIAVAKFSLATTETYKDRSGKLISQTEWHTVVLWRGLAELAQKYLHKGSLVYIEGRLKTRSWEDKETGGKRSTMEVVVEDFNFVSGGNRGDGGDYSSGSSSRSSSASSKKAEPEVEDIDDKPIDLSEIPF